MASDVNLISEQIELVATLKLIERAVGVLPELSTSLMDFIQGSQTKQDQTKTAAEPSTSAQEIQTLGDAVRPTVAAGGPLPSISAQLGTMSAADVRAAIADGRTQTVRAQFGGQPTDMPTAEMARPT